MVSKKLPATLVVGASGTGKRTFVSKIIGKELTSSDSCLNWIIDNSYYTAETKVVIRRPDGSGKFGSLAGYEATVLVVDASAESSWDTVRTWADTNMDEISNSDILLVLANKCDKLLLGQAGPLDIARSHWLARVQDWCIANHFEFLPACALDPAVDGALASDDSDAQGMKRALEALQAYMWPGLTMKQQSAAAAAERLQRVEAAAAEAGAGGALEAGQGGAPSAAANGAAASEGAAAAAARLLQQGATEGSLGAEADVDALDKLFADLVGMRDRMAGMPDEQRREAAAAMALKLAGAFGLEEEDSADEVDG